MHSEVYINGIIYILRVYKFYLFDQILFLFMDQILAYTIFMLKDKEPWDDEKFHWYLRVNSKN